MWYLKVENLLVGMIKTFDITIIDIDVFAIKYKNVLLSFNLSK